MDPHAILTVSVMFGLKIPTNFPHQRTIFITELISSELGNFTTTLMSVDGIYSVSTKFERTH